MIPYCLIDVTTKDEGSELEEIELSSSSSEEEEEEGEDEQNEVHPLMHIPRLRLFQYASRLHLRVAKHPHRVNNRRKMRKTGITTTISEKTLKAEAMRYLYE